MMPDKIQSRVLFLHGLFGAIHSTVGIFLLLRIPSEAKNAVLLGLSPERWVMLAGLGILGAFFLRISWGVIKTPTWYRRFAIWLIAGIQKQNVWAGVVVLSAFLFISGFFFVVITPEITEPFAQAYFFRLQPIAFVLSGIAAQTLLVLPFLRHGDKWKQKLRENPEWIRVTMLYGAIVLIWGGFERYLLQIEPDLIGWNTLGTPLLDTQVLFVFAMGLVLLFAEHRWRFPMASAESPVSRWKLDLAIMLLLWVGAAVYWHSLPLLNNWYVSAPRYPHFEFYPNSDGVVYDTTAQSLLTGMGYKSSYLPYPRRPLYGLFLFVLYLFKGQDFEAVVSLQSMIFAIFPALVYLTIKTMHNRLAGIIAAMFVLLREGNAIALTHVITVSHSKMTMSDFPTAILVVCFTWMVFRWLNAPHQLRAVLVAGGVLAAVMQIRVETGIFLLVVFGIALFQWPRLRLQYAKSLLIFLFGMFLVLSPWVWRNYQMTGLIFLELPDNRLSFLIGRMTSSPEEQTLPPTQLEEELPSNPREKKRPLPAVLPEAQDDVEPSGVIATLTSHYAHSQSQAILLLPGTYRVFDSTIGLLGHQDLSVFWTQCCSGTNYIRRLPFWQWGKWSGEIPLQSIVPIFVNLLILALGLRHTWKKFKWNGWVPLFFCFAYYFVNALARTSGGRYLFPVDWIWIGYYSVGLAQIAAWIFQHVRSSPRSIFLEEHSFESIKTGGKPWRSFLVISVGFFLLGVSLPAAEHVFPPRFTEETLTETMTSLDRIDMDQSLMLQLEEFLNQGGEVLQGRGYYLRFYDVNEGEPGSLYPAVYPRPYAHLNIFLVGPTNIGVVLPLKERPVIEAGNAASVLVFGCEQFERKASYFDTLAMYYPSTGEIFIRESFPETLACPLPPP